MTDETNKANMKMLIKVAVAYFVLSLICVILVSLMSLAFGMEQYSPVPMHNQFDRPRASVCYHDHRL